jgi:5-methylcytosine-specific restriction endonuclease McrA
MRGVYERTPEQLAAMTKRILTVRPNPLSFVTVGGLRGTPEYKERVRKNVRRAMRTWHRTDKGRWQAMRYRAQQCNYELSLSFEEAARLHQLPCSYCGGVLPDAGCGIDRQDNRLGYTVANSVPCCSSCNRKKGRLEQLGFMFPRTVELLRELLR